MSDRKTAVVTGGARGIGAAHTRMLASMGYDVVVGYREDQEGKSQADLVEQIAKEAKASGSKVIGFEADLSSYEACASLADFALGTFGGSIDVLVNNAGISRNKPFVELEPAEYENTIAINFMAQFHLCHLILPRMLERGSGCIVNTASIAGQMGFKEAADYTSSKHAVVGLTRALALEFADKGIRVNCICPGPIWTDMMAEVPPYMLKRNLEGIPMGRFGTPEEVAQCLRFIIEDEFLTGQCIAPNGGMFMA